MWLIILTNQFATQKGKISKFDPMDFIGPRFVDVDVRGNNVFTGIRQVIDTGYFKTLSVPIFDRDVGTVLDSPSGKAVRDIYGQTVGILEGGLFGPKTLRHW